jgi:hypothetical protein
MSPSLLFTVIAAAICFPFVFSSASTVGGRNYRVGAFYYGPWHVDPENEKLHGKNWTEVRLSNQF